MQVCRVAAFALSADLLLSAQASLRVSTETESVVDDSAATPTVTVREEDVQVDSTSFSPGVVLEMTSGETTTTLEAVKIKGGIVQSFKLNGHSIFSWRGEMAQLDGSVSWPAPQSAWGWPPPVEIEATPSGNYTYQHTLDVDQASKSFTLTSGVSDALSLQLSKRISVDPDSGAILLDYTLRNTGEQARSWAPWEVTRVPANGLSFYATGSLEPTSGTWPPLNVTEIGGVTWHQHRISDAASKLYADTAEGWLAHTDGVLVMVKCFDKIPADAAAPGEQQIEIFDGETYVEVEAQGAYQSIPAGGELQWPHSWHLREIPEGVDAVPGNAQLVAFVRDLCEESMAAWLATVSAWLFLLPIGSIALA